MIELLSKLNGWQLFCLVFVIAFCAQVAFRFILWPITEKLNGIETAMYNLCKAVREESECGLPLHTVTYDTEDEAISAANAAWNRRAQPENEPPCYIPEKDNPYPLCVGRGMTTCAHCCLWADYDSDEDESRVNKPLSPDGLATLAGEPVWIKQGINISCKVLVRFINPVCYEARRFFFTDGTLLHLAQYGTGWLAYRTKPEGSEGNDV